MKDKIYIIPEPKDQECRFCHKMRELRGGCCFACADAQSIIANGVDMYDKEEALGTELPIKEANARLDKLIKNGWVNNEPD